MFLSQSLNTIYEREPGMPHPNKPNLPDKNEGGGFMMTPPPVRITLNRLLLLVVGIDDSSKMHDLSKGLQFFNIIAEHHHHMRAEFDLVLEELIAIVDAVVEAFRTAEAVIADSVKNMRACNEHFRAFGIEAHQSYNLALVALEVTTESTAETC